MNIIYLEDRVYGAEITKYMKNIFPELEKAYVCFYADNKREATQIGNNYFKEKDIQKGNFECNGDSILLEFKNGNKVRIWNSEWGGITLTK